MGASMIEFDPDKEDLRDHLREDRDGSRTHRLVQALAARSKAVQAQAPLQGDGDEVARETRLAEVLMRAANVIEKLSPRLRS
jgi:hypothetical protein